MRAFEVELLVRLPDGRELHEYVVSDEHAADVVRRWAAGECGSNYQSACGDFHPCARPAGHEGYCSHRAERGD